MKKPNWKENKEVLILTKYGRTIIGEWNARTQTFMADGYREEDFEQWMELPEWSNTSIYFGGIKQ